MDYEAREAARPNEIIADFFFQNVKMLLEIRASFDGFHYIKHN